MAINGSNTSYLGGVEFVGPCANQIEFVIDGTLLAPSNPWAIKKDTWIHSRYISNLIISGADTHDGQGQVSWPLNDCHKNPSCPKLASVLLVTKLDYSRRPWDLHS
ncbi:BnaC09g33100D [Brassica napus]|uniref:BnaC09g33100D protein n=1 Tax=Brassica napus TaxID=3708 RepID=A0A078H7L2_BRANA|nr:BnaC09g33100D [Brassica napus]